MYNDIEYWKKRVETSVGISTLVVSWFWRRQELQCKFVKKSWPEIRLHDEDDDGQILGELTLCIEVRITINKCGVLNFFKKTVWKRFTTTKNLSVRKYLMKVPVIVNEISIFISYFQKEVNRISFLQILTSSSHMNWRRSSQDTNSHIYIVLSWEINRFVFTNPSVNLKCRVQVSYKTLVRNSV